MVPSMDEPHPDAGYLRPIAEIAFTVLKMLEGTPKFTHSLNGLLVALSVSRLFLDNEDVTPSSVAQDTGLPKSTVTRLLSFYIEDELLLEEEDERDRRKKVLKPGPNHEVVYDRIASLVAQVVEKHWGERILKEIRTSGSQSYEINPFADHVARSQAKLADENQPPDL